MEDAAYTEAVLVEDGVIKALGDRDGLAANAPDAKLYNLEGRTLLPAFIDPHSHFSAAANSFLQLSLDGTTTIEEIGEKITAFIRENRLTPGSWVIAKGYDHNDLPGSKHPDITFLDRYAPENPLVLQHKSGHVGVFNSAALRELGVTADTEAPAGGRIGKLNGALTGYMEENAFVFYLQKMPMPDMQTMLAAYQKAQELYASYGIATVQEGMMVDSLIPLYKTLLEQRLLRLDIVGFPGRDAEAAFSSAFPRAVKSYDNHFKIGGMKIFLDGSPQGKTAWMRTPYQGDPDYCGYGTMEDDAVFELISYAFEHRLQILAHCNGDMAAEQYIRCIQKAVDQKMDIQALRPVMIHAQFLGRDQLAAVKRLGILPSFFVGHVYHWGDTHIKNFGLRRAAQISPAASALREGIRFTFHQDTPVTMPDMLESVWCAVNRVTKNGVKLGADESISILEGLKAVTCNAAYQYFEESAKGSISPGKQADFVILDKNPLAVDAAELRSVRVLATVKSGTLLWQKENI